MTIMDIQVSRGWLQDEPAETNGDGVSLDAINRLPTSRVPVGRLNPGPFLRQAGTDLAHVQILADVAASSKLPPILVQKSNLRIIDGMHRVEAAKLGGQEYIGAHLIDCTDDEALILALKSNALHGLPLARVDRISGAKQILAANPDWSDRAVAAASGLGTKTIAAIRAKLLDSAQQFEKRLGRDGKRRPVRGMEGRKRVVEYIAIRPDASLREIARETDVSVGTVHDVRERMRRGLDPTAGKGGRNAGDSEDAATQVTRARPAVSAKPLDSHTVRGGIPEMAWSVTFGKLANDPALKYSENGKQFLRWLNSHIMCDEEWKSVVDAVPVHWLNAISRAAEVAAEEWREFSKELRSRLEHAS